LNDRLTLTGQILTLTDKQVPEVVGGGALLRWVGIEVYRTEANGTIYYLDSTFANPRHNGATNNGKFTIILSQSDVAVSANAILIEPQARNVAPPSLRCLTVWQNRLCGIGPDGRTIWISSIPADTEQPSWNEAYNVVITDAVQLTAIAAMDDKLVAFSERRIWSIAGQAPDVNGNNGNLVPQLISSDVGAIDERGVVAFSAGVMFQGADAFYLLDRGLTVQPVGLAVQSYNALYPVCTSATVVDFESEVRFTMATDDLTSSGISLVYHSSLSAWTKRTHEDLAFGGGVGFCSSALASGVWYGGCSGQSLSILQEDQTTWLDSGAFVSSSIVTPWIKMAGIQGFTRCQRIQFIFRPKTSASLYCELSADGESAPFYTNTFTSTQVATGRVEVHIPRQKVEMFKAKWEDRIPGAGFGTGQGIEMVAMRLLVGVKKGVGKLIPATQKA
jgi:hypothetical protein